MHNVIIGAPFGNYLSFKGTTRTYGTFTSQHRGGLAYRLWRMLRTLRYNRRQQSWINQLGLPNPGVHHGGHTVLSHFGDFIFSVHGYDAEDWAYLVKTAASYGVRYIELNVSCPNAPGVLRQHLDAALTVAKPFGVIYTAKLPPVRWMDWGKYFIDHGVYRFHLCNTIPTPGGGISGKPLIQYVDWALDDFRAAYGNDVELTAGGGITCTDDVVHYYEHGADRVSINSMLLNPFKWRRVKDIVTTANTRAALAVAQSVQVAAHERYSSHG